MDHLKEILSNLETGAIDQHQAFHLIISLLSDTSKDELLKHLYTCLDQQLGHIQMLHSLVEEQKKQLNKDMDLRGKMFLDREKVENPEIPCCMCGEKGNKYHILFRNNKVCRPCLTKIYTQAQANKVEWDVELRRQLKIKTT